MKEIEPQSLLARIAPQRLCYLTEYLDLSSPEMLAKWAMECWANEDESCFAVVWQYPSWGNVHFIGYDKAFCKAVLSRFKTTNVAFAYPPEEARPKVRIRGLKEKRRCIYECFTCEGPAPTEPINPHIRLLEKDEYDLVRPIVRQKEDLQDKCVVLAWLENGAAIGYISYSLYEGMEDSWDVNYIFSLPEHRGRGIGTALAYAYLKDIRARDCVPYYSGVSNPASAAAARKAGFLLCGTRYAFTYKRPLL